MSSSEQNVATLVFPAEYSRQLNSVSSVTTHNVIHLKRKFLSKLGWELVPVPLGEFRAIEYRNEISLARIVFGACLSLLVLFVLAMLVKYWNDLEPRTRVPVGALALAGAYGTRLLLGARRHRFIFVRNDGSRLTWKSRAGDEKAMQPLVDKLIAFAITKDFMN